MRLFARSSLKDDSSDFPKGVNFLRGGLRGGFGQLFS